jgi:hypothetical protein
MNQRIQELQHQSMSSVLNGNDPDGDVERMYIPAEFTTKFAELIVQECVAQIRPMWNQVKEVGAPPGYDYDTFDLAYNDCMNAIKEHFGVEE